MFDSTLDFRRGSNALRLFDRHKPCRGVTQSFGPQNVSVEDSVLRRPHLMPSSPFVLSRARRFHRLLLRCAWPCRAVSRKVRRGVARRDRRAAMVAARCQHARRSSARQSVLARFVREAVMPGARYGVFAPISLALLNAGSPRKIAFVRTSLSYLSLQFATTAPMLCGNLKLDKKS